ncbi:MAG: UDP-N-acetylmuramoyl-L-alanyl-D-glutamate--2,6-diaminopimelate ligase [Oscillospiraceae bacterium]
MKLKELLDEVEVLETNADLDMDIADIKYDSRAVRQGDLFVAIVGFETDGHKYIASAMESGAAAVLCQIRPDAGVPFIRVKNSRLALALVSKVYFRAPAEEMKMIGVTGTNGKTTSTVLIKQMLESVLNAKVGLIGTNSNMIGNETLPAERTTPESYEVQKLFRRMADEGCTYVVMEVSSHALTLDRVAGIRFAVGLFTNLTQDHLDFHGTMENYAEAKALLFSQCERGIVNLDDDWAKFMLAHAKCPMMTYSVDSMEGDLIARDLRIGPSDIKFVALHGDDGLARVRLPIPGKFSVYNALGVIACGICLGLEMDACVRSLETAHGVKGRVEVVPTDGDYTILIDYAHTPDALENVLRAMKENAEGRVVVLFGCGGDRDRTKRPIMGAIAAKTADFVIVTSDNPRTEEPMAIIDEIVKGMKGIRTPHVVIENRREAIAYAIDNHLPGDVIILAGKGHETYQVLGKEKHHMDEREIIAEHLRARAQKNKD